MALLLETSQPAVGHFSCAPFPVEESGQGLRTLARFQERTEMHRSFETVLIFYSCNKNYHELNTTIIY